MSKKIRIRIAMFFTIVFVIILFSKPFDYDKPANKGVYASMDTTTVTTIDTADVYEPILGDFTNNPLESFVLVGTPAIEYRGANPTHFLIVWDATICADANGTTVHIGVKINGVLQDTKIMGTFLKYADECGVISGSLGVYLVYGDEVQLVVVADGDGDEITFFHFTTAIIEFFR